MKTIIQKNTFTLTDTFTNKTKYTVFIVSDNEDLKEVEPFSIVVPEKGYIFNVVNVDHVYITFDFDSITVGKCALMASLITKTEIEQLANAIWNEYCKALDKEMMEEVGRSNLSEDFFNWRAGL
jgi:hypothetical protein